MKRVILSILFISLLCTSRTQTIGGNSVFNFLKLPNAPQLSALGGINISAISNDIGLSFNNPSLLRQHMHTQVTTVFNSMYAGIKNYHMMMGYTHPSLQTNFSLGVFYFDYGAIPQTDAAGNILGSFRPADYVAQLSASRRYMEKWHYGITVKFINSNYGFYRSNGIALDAAVAYYDSANSFQSSLVMKNMGAQLKKYPGALAEDIPFDIQIGITKRLEKAPVQLSITAHHLHQFDIRYNDTAFNNDIGINQGDRAKKFTIDKIFRHFIFAAQLFVSDNVEITAAYNHLRRSELNISNTTNGMNGFSLGMGVLFRKIQLRYARAYYQNNTAYNQFGLNFRISDLGFPIANF